MTEILREEHTHDEHLRISRLSCTTDSIIKELFARFHFNGVELTRMMSSGKSKSFTISIEELETLYLEMKAYQEARWNYEDQQEQEYQDLVQDMTRRAAALDGTLEPYADNTTLARENREFQVIFASRFTDIEYMSIYGIKKRIERLEQIAQEEDAKQYP